jgi:NAD(P)-dependent dehydrogenase (short-subunit alcohol dehydrogenase family)
MKEFREKVAVITGAASGIGRAIAQRCALEGMRIVLSDVNETDLAETEAELKSTGAAVVGVKTDVSSRGEVEALAERTLDTFGAVHLLFNNAGVVGGSSPWESTWNDWEWVLGVNLWGVIHGIKVFTPLMLAQDTQCHVVNTASPAGLVSYVPEAPYHISKHAVVALSENLAVSLAQRGALVKVSVFCPGFVRTRIFDSERNRPVALQNESNETTPTQISAKEAAKKALETGMSPTVAADLVFKAIVEDRFYILTHPEEMPHIRDRTESLLSVRNPRNPYQAATVNGE